MPHPPTPIGEFIERHETLRMIREWIADLMADREEVDTSILWEDGEDHEDDLVA
jgi:hypothetical protein